ncbi:histidine phosphatase family protein [soil metagenome]
MNDSCRLILVRHGQTAWNAERRLQGHTDVGLSERGEREALAVGAALANEPIDAIWSSDLLRAHRTAACIAAHHAALSIRTDRALRERSYGVFEGLRLDELSTRHPEAVAGWSGDVLSLVPPQGELRRDFHHRIAAALASVAAAHPGQTVCVATHGGVLDVAYRLAGDVAFDAARQWSIVNAGINRLTITAGRFSLQSWGEDAHLAAVL